MTDLAERLVRVRGRIAAACRTAGRPVDEVTLVAVSKTFPPSICAEAVAAGQALLGENYAQELREKAALVDGAHWHFIGPLQRNKVKYVVGVAELIHSVDRVELAAELATRAERVGTTQRCLVQVNVAREPQKAGCAPEDLPALLDAMAAHPSLRCEGLMCIPPANCDPTPHFDALRRLAAHHHLPQLSMGMSDDFELAIAHGATLVRVGSAIFGARPAQAV
jgi:pyridoxal phosphate enzyme (YggS family)